MTAGNAGAGKSSSMLHSTEQHAAEPLRVFPVEFKACARKRNAARPEILSTLLRVYEMDRPQTQAGRGSPVKALNIMSKYEHGGGARQKISIRAPDLQPRAPKLFTGLSTSDPAADRGLFSRDANGG